MTPSHCDAMQLYARAGNFTSTACAQAHQELFDKIAPRKRKPVHALGMKISPLEADDVVEAILADVATSEVRLVVTPNLDHVRRLRIPAFAAAYASAALVCPDGLPVLLYARLRGLRLRARVTGCELFSRLSRHVGLRKHDLFLVVESQSTALAARRWAAGLGLADRMSIVAAPTNLDSDRGAQAELAQRIGAARPTILVMTLGAPVSEVFVHRNRHLLPPCWALCVGQALRVELALTRRAPGVWQRLGLEWLWRLGHEPRRLLSRYVQSLAWFSSRDLARPDRARRT